MKGNKLVIAVILALIVCLVLIPTCAFADEAVPDAQTDGQQQTEQTYEQSNAAAPDTSDAAVTEKDDSSDNDEDSSLPDSGDKEAADPASGDNSSNDQSVDGDETKGEEPKGNETEESKVVEEGTSGGENVPLQPESGSSFKVILSYGDKSVELNDLKGGEQNDLAAIVSQLGIEGDIESAQGDADELFSAASTEDGWKLVTSKAFGTKQTLTLVVGGVEYVIDVADDVTVTTSKDLIDAVKTDNTIILGNDIELTDGLTIESGKTITIDLNGWTLTYSKANHTNTINNHGNLTIRDSVGTGKVDNTVVQGAPIYNSPNGNLTIESGTITRSKEQGINKDGYAGINGNSFYTIWNEGTMTIKGGRVENNGSFSSNVCNKSNAKLTIEDGEFVGGKATINNKDTSTVIIKGGTFTNENGVEDGGVVKNEGSMTLNGGTFNGPITNIAGSNFNIGAGIFTDTALAKSIIKAGGAAVTKYGDQYGINDAAYELAEIAANNGDAIEIVSLPKDGFEISDIPEGVKFVNNSGKTLIINGVEVKDSTEYTVPASDPKPAEETKTTSAAATASAPLYAKYLMLEGRGQQWTDGDLEFVLNSNAVVKVLIDGVEVEFTVAEDGTVTIASAVIEALEAGTHEIQFVFADGSCMTTFTK